MSSLRSQRPPSPGLNTSNSHPPGPQTVTSFGNRVFAEGNDKVTLDWGALSLEHSTPGDDGETPLQPRNAKDGQQAAGARSRTWDRSPPSEPSEGTFPADMDFRLWPPSLWSFVTAAPENNSAACFRPRA